ncbi:hypothetical protein ACIBPB_28750 [Micromonospora sp. NPDC049836]|uniref:hypothetical protein n=1 Tax=Micromonospora sp. NPDC049836 TaxID=3364274 RepID=UPI003799FD17
MTAREFSGVDHDLLADYLGGALDGTPEQATVARLIDDDPAWAEAYAALARAVELVRADLSGWAAAPAPQLPLAVADRITAALAGAGPAPVDAQRKATGPEVTAGVSGAPDGGPAPRPGAVPAQPTGGTRPAGGTGHHTGPGRRARRWVRIAGPVAVAAASVAAVGLGVGNLVGAGGGFAGSVADGGRPAADEAAPMAAAAPFRTTGPPQHSGTDYGQERLSGGTGTLGVGPPTPAGGKDATGDAPQDQRVPFATRLDRLGQPEALTACLTAISTEHATGPLTVDLVDFATYQGVPALVVTFVDGGGARWAWVSGPECGVPGSGADTRFRTRVG